MKKTVATSHNNISTVIASRIWKGYSGTVFSQWKRPYQRWLRLTDSPFDGSHFPSPNLPISISDPALSSDLTFNDVHALVAPQAPEDA